MGCQGASWQWHRSANREWHDSQNRRPGIARISTARSTKRSGVAVKHNRGRSTQNRQSESPPINVKPRPWNRAILNRPILDSESPIRCHQLRGPVVILFISRDTCSDSIAKLFRACFCGVSHNYRAICCKMGYRTDVPV